MKPSREEDATLARAFDLLEPSAEQVERMQAAILADYRGRHRTLTQEWIALLRVRPILHSGYVAAAAVALLVSTPLLPIWSALVHLVAQ